jgi:probable HAF family extracellular repeat protein
MLRVTNIRGASSVLTALAAVVLAVTYLVGVGPRPADAEGRTRYDVMPLDEAWTGSIGRDISQHGQVAGQGTNPAGQPRAFLWAGGDALDLGVPVAEGNLSRARGINDSGDVVGEWRIGVGRQARFKAFLYEDGQMKDLNTLIPAGTGWDLTGAQAINENGQVVGAGTRSGQTRAFLYEGGAVTDFGKDVLGNPYSAAWGINDRGDVVGGAGTSDLQSEAFVYRDGTVDRLGKSDGFSASEAVGINNSGQAIGWSLNPGQNPPQGEAFLYDYSGDGGPRFESLEPLDRPEESPLPDDRYTRARDVDEAGRVVGWSRNVADVPQQDQFSATLWEDNGPEESRQAQDLNDLLLPEDSDWKLVDAYAINESGQIVGSGFRDGELEAFLLNPAYDFSGFFAPVDNPPTVNTVNAGRAIPVKFSLSGDQGLGVIEEGYPKSQQVPCDAADPVDGIEETTTAGASGLTYDAASDEYTYVWKTDKAWTGCRQLVLKLDDGTVHRANFNFTK